MQTEMIIIGDYDIPLRNNYYLAWNFSEGNYWARGNMYKLIYTRILMVVKYLINYLLSAIFRQFPAYNYGTLCYFNVLERLQYQKFDYRSKRC